MSLAPFLAAPAVVQAHAACALLALVLGAAQLGLRKGGATHRLAGRAWVGLMAVSVASSLAITDGAGTYSFLHLLSVYVAVMLPLAVLSARRGEIGRHRWRMIGLYGGLLIAGAFTLSPGRIMHAVVFGG
jgi:uncharacterized membrane protein